MPKAANPANELSEQDQTQQRGTSFDAIVAVWDVGVTETVADEIEDEIRQPSARPARRVSLPGKSDKAESKWPVRTRELNPFDRIVSVWDIGMRQMPAVRGRFPVHHQTRRPGWAATHRKAA